jgi:mitochondrial fission protein ELM1
MISEILETQKPLYLFKYGQDVRKYDAFLQSIIEKGCVRIFNYAENSLEKYKYEKINDIKSICSRLAKKLGLG